MYNKLLELKGKKILEKYELIDIDLSNILMYRWSYDYLFPNQKLTDKVFLKFVDLYWDNILFEIFINQKLEIVELLDNKHNDLLNYLINSFNEFQKKLSKEKLEKVFSLNNDYSQLKIIYYLFWNNLDYNSFLILIKNKKKIFKNKEPFIWKIDWENLIYNSDRSKIYKNWNILEKRFFWINSIFWTSNEQIFLNSIFLSKFWYIEKVILNQDSSISYFYEYKENVQEDFSLKTQIKSLIDLNKKTFLWYHNLLKISYIQEDPNKDNFLWNEIIDFDVVNMSYSFLQPIYLILDLAMWKDFKIDDIFKIFKYVISFFTKNEYYYMDFKLLWWEKIFEYYNKIYTKWLEENNDWLCHHKEKLEYKKNLLIQNRENILMFLENEIK